VCVCVSFPPEAEGLSLCRSVSVSVCVCLEICKVCEGGRGRNEGWVRRCDQGIARQYTFGWFPLVRHRFLGCVCVCVLVFVFVCGWV
jgi:hypothetical protein